MWWHEWVHYLHYIHSPTSLHHHHAHDYIQFTRSAQHNEHFLHSSSVQSCWGGINNYQLFKCQPSDTHYFHSWRIQTTIDYRTYCGLFYFSSNPKVNEVPSCHLNKCEWCWLNRFNFGWCLLSAYFENIFLKIVIAMIRHTSHLESQNIICCKYFPWHSDMNNQSLRIT